MEKSLIQINSELREELKETVKKEFRNILFEERYFETAIKSYIKSLCFQDINYVFMLNRGLVKNGAITFENPEYSTKIWMKIKSNVNINKLYEEYKFGKHIKCSFENFEAAINFEPIENFESDEEIIVWTGNGKKKFTYKGLFDLYHRIYDEDFSKIHKSSKDLFLAYISVKFKFEGVFKSFNLINRSFIKAYDWKDK